jgi:hypothetical protein
VVLDLRCVLVVLDALGDLSRDDPGSRDGAQGDAGFQAIETGRAKNHLVSHGTMLRQFGFHDARHGPT